MEIFEKLESLGFFEWLKEKGFGTGFTAMILDNQPVDSIERTGYNAIAFRWFREKHKLNFNVVRGETNFGFKVQYLSKFTNNWHAGYSSYEEAELACLDKLLEIVESKSE